MSNDNQNNQFEEILQDIKDIKSKLLYVSGFNIATRSEIVDNFQKLYAQNQRHLNMIQNKAALHFSINLFFSFLLFLKQLSFFITFISDQYILKFFELIFTRITL